MAAFTIAGYLTAIRSFFEWLESIKAYPNVAKSIRGPKRRPGFKRGGDPLFASHSTKNFGCVLTTRSVSRIVKNHLRAIGIDDRRISAHSLRHTAITMSMLAGATAQEARIMARHADINTTLIYAHNINRILNAPERKIDDLLG